MLVDLDLRFGDALGVLHVGGEARAVGERAYFQDDLLFVVAANRHRRRTAPVKIQAVPRPAKLQRTSDVFVRRADAIILLTSVDRDQIKIALICGISHRRARMHRFVPLRHDVAPLEDDHITRDGESNIVEGFFRIDVANRQLSVLRLNKGGEPLLRLRLDDSVANRESAEVRIPRRGDRLRVEGGIEIRVDGDLHPVGRFEESRGRLSRRFARVERKIRVRRGRLQRDAFFAHVDSRGVDLMQLTVVFGPSR